MKQTATLIFRTRNLGISIRCILMLLFLNLIVQNTSAQQVKIDGLSNSFANEWTQASITHFQDLFGNGVAEDQFTEGSKDWMYAADWRWSISQTKGKNDLANGAGGILPAGSVLLADGSVAPGGPFLVFAGDRLVNNGDAQIGFWFFQDGTAPVTQANGTQNFAPPKHIAPVIGDILILADFTGGGRDATVTVLEWTGGGGNYSEHANFNLLDVGAAVAENNTGTTPLPSGWLYNDTEYETNEFFEGYVNLANFGAGAVCFSRFMLEGRSSQEITAALDDFIGGPLGSVPNCSITGSNTICQGSSTCFTATGGPGSFTYTWSGPSGYSNTGAVICNLSVGGTYNVTVSNATGCTTSCSRILTVNPPPGCNVTGNNTICLGGSTSFTATAGAASYVWSGPGSFTGQGTNVISNVTAAGTYNVTVTSAAGCTNVCSRELTVNQPPGCTVSGNNTICSGGSTSFTATAGGATYVWSGPGGFTGQGTNVISNVTAAGTYNVTITSAQTCTSTCSITLIVNDTPGCTIDGPSAICNYQTASFTATAGGTNYVWSGPGTFTGQGTNVISNITTAGTYNVTITATGGCTSTCSKNLTVNTPINCVVDGTNTICAGTSTSFTATAGGSTYVWAGPGSFTGQGTNVISNVSVAGTYNVTITSPQGCTSTCGRTLTINQPPTVDAGNAPAAQCREASVVNNSLVFGTNVFSVTGTASGGTFQWSVQNNGGFTVLLGDAASLTTNVSVSGANQNGGSVTLRLTVTSNTTPPCGTVFDDVVLTLNPRPLIKVVEGSDFCPNVTTTGSVTLKNSEPNVSYQLFDDGPNPVQSPKIGDGSDLVWTGLDPGNYTVEGTFPATDCSSTSGPGEVEENPVPDVTITPIEDLCTSDACVDIVVNPQGGTLGGNGVVNGQFCPGTAGPGSHTITYTYTNDQGCTNSASIQVQVNSCEAPLCTYTQGAFGNEGGQDCDGTTSMPTKELIEQSLANWGGTLTIGATGSCSGQTFNRTLTVSNTAAQIDCVVDKLPGGGPAAELSGASDICTFSDLKNGRINNVLLAQTLTLGLNLGIGNPQQDLGGFPLQAGCLSTAKTIECGSPDYNERTCEWVNGILVVQNEYETRCFSQALIDVLDDFYTQDVAGLFALANDALGNKDCVAGSEHGLSLSEIAGAAGSINEVFDECRVAVGWDLGPCVPESVITPPRISANANAEGSTVTALKVTTYPNPFRDRVRFVIQSPVAGQAVLEVYNVTGQRLQTLYNGRIEANETKMVDYRPVTPAAGMMIYRLKVGNKTLSGKVIGLTL